MRLLGAVLLPFLVSSSLEAQRRADTTVVFATAERDLTGDGHNEVLRLVGVGPSIDSLIPRLTIEDAGRLIFADEFAPITRRIGFDGPIRMRSEAEHREFLRNYGNWVFASEKFLPPSEYLRQLRTAIAHDPPPVPPLVTRETWAEIAAGQATVFTYSPGGDRIEAIVWHERQKQFVRLIDCC